MTGAEEILGSSLFQWIDMYGHLVLVVIMLVEGTVTSFIAGALSSGGLFNPFLIILSFLFARLIADSVLIFMSRYASDFLYSFSFAKRAIDKIHVDSEERGDLSRFIEDHFILSLFIAQIIPVALIHSSLIIAAGTMKMSIKKIYLSLFIAQPILSAGIVGFGYFFGGAVRNPAETINLIGLVISLIIIGVFMYWKYAHKWILERTKLGFLVKNGANERK